MNNDNTALLVIDVINSCAHERCEVPKWNVHFGKIRQMVPRLVQFIEDYRQQVNDNIIFGKTKPWRKEYLADNVSQLYEDERFEYYSTDTSGFAEEFYSVIPKEGDLVFDKDNSDALTNPELLAELEKRGIKYIVTTGVFTDGCVLATVAGGFSKGFNFVVVKDMVETTDSATRQEIQKHLLNYTFPYLFARVVSGEELLQSFS